jgi:hypothetical protein
MAQSASIGSSHRYRKLRSVVFLVPLSNISECWVSILLVKEIDDEFLVISDTLPGNVKWKTVNVHELQDILITKVEEGFTFPINPKW